MISHYHKCIFVHVPKTAGKSIETAFLDSLGLTWKTRAPLLLRANDEPELGPPRLAHLYAKDYVRLNYISGDLFENYFKFSFIRNPWDRMISIYKYSRYSLFLSFRIFFKSIFLPHIWPQKQWFVAPQSEFICDDSGKVMVDFIGRYENLCEDFNSVCKVVGLAENSLQHVNKSSQEVSRPAMRIGSIGRYVAWNMLGKRLPRYENYQEYYDYETAEIVYDLYLRDIEMFHYSF